MAVPQPAFPSPSEPNPAFSQVESVDPATNEVIARFPVTNPSALPEIFRRARDAQRGWAETSVRGRREMLRLLRDAIFARRHEIAGVITRETGKPLAEAIFSEVLLALDTANFLAGRAPRWLRAQRVPHHNVALKSKSGRLCYEPHGIVAIISPWNYPFAIPITQVIAATVAGNAVVLKPSELTPWTGSLIAELCSRARFPEALVQVVQGGAELGAALIEAGPDKVCFTGSPATGRGIAEACARKLIPSLLELGGKDAMLVLADADLEAASSAAVWGSFTNCGQACLSVERIYVAQPVAEEFTRRCVEKTKKLRLGTPSDAEAEIGPMIRERQIERVEQHLRDAVERGAQILAGGKRRPDLGPNFFEPTVVARADHSMRLIREETFGPVLAICAVKSVEEAIALANDSAFALSASVWTRNTRRAREIARHLRAGSVMINDVASYYAACEAPHGGRGESGWGRTHSRLGLLEMVQPKYVDVDRLPRLSKPWWFGYSADLAEAANRFLGLLFAPSWRMRRRAAADKRLRLLLSRRDKI